MDGLSVPVAESKLVLIDRGPRSQSNENVLLFKVPDQPGYTGRFGIKKDIVMSPSEWNSGDCIDPIIISETEKIEKGDWGLSLSNVLKQFNDPLQIDIIGYLSTWRKVLVLPEQFSPKQLQAIVDGKMKDGDKVLVECEKVYETDPECPTAVRSYCIGNHIKLTEGYVTLHRIVERMIPESEIPNIIREALTHFMKPPLLTEIREWYERK